MILEHTENFVLTEPVHCFLKQEKRVTILLILLPSAVSVLIIITGALRAVPCFVSSGEPMVRSCIHSQTEY